MAEAQMKYLLHVVVWAVIAVGALLFGGPYTFFNCWQFFFAYFPIVLWLILAAGSLWSLIKIVQCFAGSVRSSLILQFPIHFVILIGGLSFEVVVAQWAHPKSSCL